MLLTLSVNRMLNYLAIYNNENLPNSMKIDKMGSNTKKTSNKIDECF